MAPLTKRLPRQLKNNWTRYLALFLMFIFFVGICSGFKAACSSLQKMSDESRETYTVEDGRFTSNYKLTEDVIEKIEDKGVKVSELFSIETSAEYKSGNGTCDFRAYQDRFDVDLLAYHEGHAPVADDEIVLDRNFFVDNEFQIGDKITIEGAEFKVVGAVSSPDNVMLFKNNTDMMGNSISFGMGWTSADGFARIESTGATVAYSYAFVCNDRSLSDAERIDVETEIANVFAEERVPLTSFIDSASNSGINFAADDFAGDTAIIDVLLLVIVVLFAFIFTVLIASTIDAESAVIGTLMASGYLKREIVAHYMVLPTLTGFFGVIFGNIFGYAWVINFTASLYSSSYSLPPFVATFDVYAFIETTVVPFVLLVAINLFALVRKMKLKPLQFLRHDLKKAKRISKFNIPEKLPFSTRFRMRVFLQNKANFFTLFLGILLGSMLLVFGFCILPTMNDYCESLKSSQPAQHVYTLKAQAELSEADANKAEKIAVTTVKIPRKFSDAEEEVTVYGIQENSKFWDELKVSDMQKGQMIAGTGLLQKCKVNLNDAFEASAEFTNDTYDLTAVDTWGPDTNINIYMSIENFREVFDEETDYFNGYVSNEELQIDSAFLVRDTTPKDLEAVAEQMNSVMTRMVGIFVFLAVAIFLIMMYLLTKVIVDRASRSISYMKVFGYRKSEINRLYINSITATVLLSLLVSMPIIIVAISWMMKVAMADYAGNIVCVTPPIELLKTFLIGFATYAFVALIDIHHIRKVPMTDALKVQE